MPNKLLFLVNTLHIGGAERNVALLCRHIDRSRFDPEVWVFYGGGHFEDQVVASGIRIRHLGRRWARDPLFAWKTAREISRSDADLIHAFLPSIGIYGAFARTWFGVRQPMVLSLGQSSVGRSERWMFRWCSRTFDWLVTNSPSAQGLGRSLGFSSKRMTLIPNGHEVDSYCKHIDRAGIRRSVGIGPDDPMLLCVGRLIDSKRVCDAIAAMSLLVEGTCATLVVVGDGPERNALESEAIKRGLGPRVVFAGQRGDVPELLGAADLFLFPSETEGLPNALIEASLAGLPIVACRVAGVVDVVTHDESALLVPPRSPAALAAAVRRLLTDRAEAERLATTAQVAAKNRYGVEQSLTVLYDVYDQLLCGNQRRTAEQVAGVAANSCS